MVSAAAAISHQLVRLDVRDQAARERGVAAFFDQLFGNAARRGHRGARGTRGGAGAAHFELFEHVWRRHPFPDHHAQRTVERLELVEGAAVAALDIRAEGTWTARAMRWVASIISLRGAASPSG